MPQPKEPITTALVEALHFRTGFHYIMVREMEMQIPIPSLPGKLPVEKGWKKNHPYQKQIYSKIELLNSQL